MEKSPASLFEESFEKIEELKKVKERTTKKYSIAGNCFEISYFSSELFKNLNPAIAHLELENQDSPTMSMFVLDLSDLKNKLEIPKIDKKDSTETAYYRYKDKHYNYLEIVHIDNVTISLLDLQKQRSIFCVSNPENLKFFQKGKPFLDIFYPWLKSKNFRIIHAAAIGINKQGLILGGIGGSGKSTTSLAAFGRGLEFAGDDYVIYNSENQGYCLYSSVAIDANSRERQTWLGPEKMKTEIIEKENLFLQQLSPDKILNEYKIKAIILPRVAHKEFSSINNISAMQGLRLLAPSTVLQVVWAEQDELSDLSSLVQKVPCYQLNLGTNLEQTIDLLREMLE